MSSVKAGDSAQAGAQTVVNTSPKSSVSKENEITRQILCYLDCVRYFEYRGAFIDVDLDETKLEGICGDAAQMSYFLAKIGVDETHKELLSNMLRHLHKKDCLHLCIEKWKFMHDDPDGPYVCIQCGYKYLNCDDSRVAAGKNLGDVARDRREREIEQEVNIKIEELHAQDGITPELIDVEKKDKLGKASAMRGIPIGWLEDFTIANNCSHMKTQDVCMKYIWPAIATERCRYVELDHMKGIVGQTNTFISHCRHGIWGDLVAAVCDGDADRNRRVWIDIFACRQWPSKHPDLNFDDTIRHCNSLLLVCSSPKKLKGLTYEQIMVRDMSLFEEKNKVAFLRVWCLKEIYGASQVKGMPIIMKLGSHTLVKEKGETSFKFIPDYELLKILWNSIDIKSAESTVPSDKIKIIDELKGGDGLGIVKVNSLIRSIILSAMHFRESKHYGLEEKDDKIGFFHNASLEAERISALKHYRRSEVQNAACGDESSVTKVLSKIKAYLPYIFLGGYTRLLDMYKGKINSAEINVAFQLACRGGHLGSVMYILEKYEDEINLHAKTTIGFTGFILACEDGQFEIVRYLLNYKVDNPSKRININDQTHGNNTALISAASRGFIDVVELLLSHKANVNAQTFDGHTALMYASENGHEEVASLLLQHKADANKTTDDGTTALIYAALYGFPAIVIMLLRHKADPRKSTGLGQTALSVARDAGISFLSPVRVRTKDHDKCVKILRGEGEEEEEKINQFIIKHQQQNISNLEDCVFDKTKAQLEKGVDSKKSLLINKNTGKIAKPNEKCPCGSGNKYKKCCMGR